MDQLNIEAHPDFDAHELVQVHRGEYATAIIAVHSSRLGPGAGGCRMYPYASVHDALTDVLRLSRAMTYKSALADVPLGGGKSVVIANPAKDKSRELLLEVGEFVDSLGGRYYAAEDSGTCVADIVVMAERTPFVCGIAEGEAHGGDPSPVTALGVFEGIKAAVRHRLGSDLNGVRVAVQGVGNVGRELVRMLTDAGAQVIVADVSVRNIERVQAECDVRVVSPERILAADVDVLAPCALGGAVNPRSVAEMRARVVAGAANNQLACPEMGEVLRQQSILFAPDYVINAGGIIDVHLQRIGERDPEVMRSRIAKIGDRLTEIFKESDLRGEPTNEIADRMARARFRPEREAA